MNNDSLPKNLSLGALIAVLFCVTVWGCNALFVKAALQTLDVSTFYTLRFLLVVPFLFMVKLPKKGWINIVLLALSWNFGCYLLLGTALTLGILPGEQMIIFQLSPLFAVLLSTVFFKEKFSVKNMFCLSVAFSSVFFLAQKSSNPYFSFTGFFMSIFAALLWGMGVCFIKKSKCQQDFSFTVWIGSVSFLFFSVYEVCLNGTHKLVHFLETPLFVEVVSILFTSLLGSVLATYIWVKLLKTYASEKVVPFLYLAPFITLFLSCSIFGEDITWLKVSLGLMVAMCLYINSRNFYFKNSWQEKFFSKKEG